MREEGDSSDDVGASVFVHKDGDIANNQCVHVELIEVFYDYFNLKENLNLPSEVQSDAHFRPVDKAGGGKKATSGGKKFVGGGKKLASRGKKPAGRNNKASNRGKKLTC